MAVKETSGVIIDKRRRGWEARVEMKVFAIDKEQLSTYDKLIYTILCGHANKDGNAWPVVQTIADEASCSTRQVRRSLTTLELCKLLVRKPRITAQDGQMGNIYEIYGIEEYTPPMTDSQGGMTDSHTPPDGESEPINDLKQHQGNSFINTSPPTPQGGDGDANNFSNPENSNLPAEKSSTTGGRARRVQSGKEGSFTAEFEQFWEKYPRKRDKSKAFRGWQKEIKLGSKADDMILAAVNYAGECARKRTEERYIKHASTFLGADRPWLEHIKPPERFAEAKAKYAAYDRAAGIDT